MGDNKYFYFSVELITLINFSTCHCISECLTSAIGKNTSDMGVLGYTWGGGGALTTP